ncbi:MAG: DMT family transporter [Planctomycetota bacterium]
MKPKSKASPLLGLTVGIFTLSFAGILIRLCGMNPFALSAFRTLAGGLILLPFALRHMRRDFPALGRRDRLLLAGAGLLMALHFVSWISSLFVTSVGSAMMTFGVLPVFASIIGHFFLGEKFRKSAAVALVVAMAGIAIISINDYAQEPASVLGNLLALCGAVTFASILCIARVLRRRMHILSYAASMYLIAGLLLAPAFFFIGDEIPGYTSEMWMFLALIIIVPQLTGHTLLNWVMKYLRAFTVNLSVLVEPVVATVLAGFILGETHTWPFFLGGALVIAGIAYHLVSEQRSAGSARGEVYSDV